MRTSNKLIIGVTTAITVGTIIYISSLKRRHRIIRRQRFDIAEEGYETAHDILFPLKARRFKKNRVKRWKHH